MKKLLYFILATILMLSITACSSETTKVVQNNEQQENNIQNEQVNNTEEKIEDKLSPTDNENTSKGKLAEAYLNIIKTEKYYIKYRMNMEGVNNEISMAVDGKNIAMESVNGEETSNIVIKDGKTYMINHKDATVFVVSNDENETTLEEPIAAYDELPLPREGTGDFLGKNLKYEEYEIAGEYIRYYFDNNKIVGIESSDDSGKYYIEILELTKDVPTGMFDIPADYVVTDMNDLYLEKR